MTEEMKQRLFADNPYYHYHKRLGSKQAVIKADKPRINPIFTRKPYSCFGDSHDEVSTLRK